MARHDKLVARFLGLPKDFEWREVVRLLNGFGYTEQKGGKTSGSRVWFQHVYLQPIELHRPHPGNILKQYAMKDLLEKLKEAELI